MEVGIDLVGWQLIVLVMVSIFKKRRFQVRGRACFFVLWTGLVQTSEVLNLRGVRLYHAGIYSFLPVDGVILDLFFIYAAA